MRLFGRLKKTKEQRQKEADDKYLARESRKEIERNRKIAKEELRRKVMAERDARQASEDERRYNLAHQRLKQRGNIEAEKTRISRQRAARAAASERKIAGYRGAVTVAGSFLGIHPKRGYQNRPRPIYVSTSHGLRKISADDPRYYEYASQQGVEKPSVGRVIVKSSDDEQPSAFSGL